MFPKQHPLDRKVPTCYSISKKTSQALKDFAQANDLSASSLVEGMIKEYLKDVSSGQ